MKRLCVFCGSGYGAHPAYRRAAKQLGAALVREHIGLVFGGANVGLMGELAKAVLHAGGDVVGVMPRGLVEKELAFVELADLRIVDSMHERKALMADLSDGFVALPGGLGTLEELFEMLTWAQLGIHNKPCGILNVEGFYSGLLGFLDHTVDQRFVEREHREMIVVDDDPDELIRRFRAYRAPQMDKARWAIQITRGVS
jgi:uncharacterized protein (TIGR00730 family)